MPYMEKTFSVLNALLAGDAINDTSAEVVADEPTLTEVLSRLTVTRTEDEVAFAETIPQSIQAALVAVLRANLLSDTRKQMTISWAPSYDWEMTVWESNSNELSAGGITVQLRSRYPTDAHPNPGLS